MFKTQLPQWLYGPHVKQLTAFFDAWWALVKTWLELPLRQIDPTTCTLGMLELLAWGRDVRRFEDEPESLYRLRVEHAFINGKDAGSIAGVQRIFERLGIGYVELLERQPDQDWDVIILNLSNAQLSGNQMLIQRIVTKYGRTCRRYVLNGIFAAPLGVSAHHAGIERRYYAAS